MSPIRAGRDLLALELRWFELGLADVFEERFREVAIVSKKHFDGLNASGRLNAHLECGDTFFRVANNLPEVLKIELTARRRLKAFCDQHKALLPKIEAGGRFHESKDPMKSPNL